MAEILGPIPSERVHASPSDPTDDPKPSQLDVTAVYPTTLGSDEIRLLDLSPSPAKDAPIHLDLGIYPDNGRPEYEAMSYTWADEGGNSDPSAPVYIGLFWMLGARN